MPKQVTFIMDDETAKDMIELQKFLNVKTNTALLRKAVALTKMAAEESKDSGGIIELRPRGATSGRSLTVALKA